MDKNFSQATVAVVAVAVATNSIKVHRVRVLMALGDNEVPDESVTCISFHLSFPSSLLDVDELRAFFTSQFTKNSFFSFLKNYDFYRRPTN